MYKLSTIKRGVVSVYDANVRAAHGFLLLEALVALMLFISGVTTIAYYHSMSANTQRNARKKLQAITWAVSCMEQCRAGRCVPLTLRSEQSGCVLTWHTKPYLDEALSQEDNLVELTLQVRWHEHLEREHVYTLSSIIVVSSFAVERLA